MRIMPPVVVDQFQHKTLVIKQIDDQTQLRVFGEAEFPVLRIVPNCQVMFVFSQSFFYRFRCKTHPLRSTLKIRDRAVRYIEHAQRHARYIQCESFRVGLKH